MRILVISSSYGTGGYGRHCAEVSTYLAEYGHNISVLTCLGEPSTSQRVRKVACTLLRDPDWDSRWPGYAQFFFSHRRRQGHNMRVLLKTLSEFSPDVVFVWQGTGLDRSLFMAVERAGYPMVYRLCDYWPAVPDEYWVYWTKHATRNVFEPTKQILSRPALKLLRHEGKPLAVNFDHAICVSDAVREQLYQAGIPLRQAVTVFNGINLQDFTLDLESLPYPRSGQNTLSLLYAGSLLEHKGVHVAIEAMRHLQTQPHTAYVQLTVLGDGPEPYVSHLRRLVSEWNLEDCVHFQASIPRQQMPEVLRKQDILLFPSLYEEPLARMMQEAMAAGVVVVSTATGGSKEILQDGVNSLIAAPGDANRMAEQVQRLMMDVGLYRCLATAAQETVNMKCDIRRTTHIVEDYLLQVVQKP